MKTSRIRRGHRWLGIFLGLQLLFWTASGAFFAWTDLDEVHGDHHRAAFVPPSFGPDWISPSEIDFDGAGIARPQRIEELAVVEIGARSYYRLRAANGDVVLADTRDGAIRPPLDREEAIDLARASFQPDAPVRLVTRLTEEDVGAHHEYRGLPLPAWRVEFDHDSGTRVYVDQRGGAVTRHRNGIWRAFDFLWMLHTMDYRGRDDFNNPVLRTVSALAIVAVLSGLLLWWRTSSLARRRRSG